MPALTGAQILAADDLPRRRVDVPEWANGSGEAYVCVRMLTAKERDEFEAWYDDAKRKGARHFTRAKLCSLAICDEEGKRQFTEGQVQQLAEKSSAALDRIFDAVMQHSGLRGDRVEDLVGNSSGGQLDDSPIA